MLESLFNKGAGPQAWRIQYICFPVKYMKFLGIPILKNMCTDCFYQVKLTWNSLSTFISMPPDSAGICNCLI